MNIVKYNSAAWDREANAGGEWSIPVSPERIQQARRGELGIRLSPNKPVPSGWFPADLKGVNILCLASGGGQQAPILAAAGANVTSFDNSAEQLKRDKLVSDRENLNITLERGDAADLSRFSDGSFDLIYHPVSNLFFPDIGPVWLECFRVVLRSGGTMLAGFCNPVLFMFDKAANQEREGILEAKYPLPFSDVNSLSKEGLQGVIDKNEPLEFGHTLEQQIGGQINAGFSIAGFYEDYWSDKAIELNKYMPVFIATKALKP
ncbi:MAG TPA: class I SAM-dependent methyltransferase [Pyrinomonadaceae bacterium]|jgi:SAM-dependent methyltransferase|nr:class I SAM-dependent methyltransferase [Pyrinomonadaceae bacterium]